MEKKTARRSSSSSNREGGQSASNSSAFSAMERKNNPVFEQQKPIDHINNQSRPSVQTQNMQEKAIIATNLISIIQNQLSYNGSRIPEHHVSMFLRKLYPVEQSQSNIYISLHRSLLQYMSIMFNKYEQSGNGYNSGYSKVTGGLYGNNLDIDYVKYDDISKDVIRIARSVNQQLSIGIKNILQRNDVKQKIVNTKLKANGNTNGHPQTIRKDNLDILSSICLKPKYPTNNNNINIDKFEGKFKADPARIAESYVKQKSSVKNLLPLLASTKKTQNFSKCIICQKQVNSNQQKQNFHCLECGRIFHISCNPRKYNCMFCQLRNINPLKQVQEELFVGILKKNTKRHQLHFKYNNDVNQTRITQFMPSKYRSSGINTPTSSSSNPIIAQIRSLRIKKSYDSICSYIILFPDACSISINSKLLKQFIPLHRQSSLKYRRDECVKLSSASSYNFGLKKGEQNTVSIVQRFLKKQIKSDQRIELDDHLIGVYLVRDFNSEANNKIEYIANRYQALSFLQSEKLIKESLLLPPENLKDKNQDIELACDTSKVSLMCSLTLAKMEYPGRGIFCNHLSCFDIMNFLKLNSQTNMPKWQCPICKAPSYDFRIDPIIQAIIKFEKRLNKNMKSKSKKKKEITDVIFYADMNYSYIDTQGTQNQKASIYDLDIMDIGDAIGKRLFNQEQPQKEQDPRIQTDEILMRVQQKPLIISLEQEQIAKVCQKQIDVNKQQSERLQLQQISKQERQYKSVNEIERKQQNLINPILLEIENLNDKPEKIIEKPKENIINSQSKDKIKYNSNEQDQQPRPSANNIDNIDNIDNTNNDNGNNSYSQIKVDQSNEHCARPGISEGNNTRGLYDLECKVVYKNNNQEEDENDEEQKMVEQLLKQQQQIYQQKMKLKQSGQQFNSGIENKQISCNENNVGKNNSGYRYQLPQQEEKDYYQQLAKQRHQTIASRNRTFINNSNSMALYDQYNKRNRDRIPIKGSCNPDNKYIVRNSGQNSYGGKTRSGGIKFGQNPPRKMKSKQFVLPQDCEIMEISD